MVATQVFNDTTVGFAGSQNFQLNVFKPVMAWNVLEIDPPVGDACVSFDIHCVRLGQNRENSAPLGYQPDAGHPH